MMVTLEAVAQSADDFFDEHDYSDFIWEETDARLVTDEKWLMTSTHRRRVFF